MRNTKTERQFGAAAIAICISWFNLIWFLRRVPDIGTYILTLQKVFKTLIKVYGFISGFWASNAMELHGEGFFCCWKCSSVTYIYIYIYINSCQRACITVAFFPAALGLL